MLACVFGGGGTGGCWDIWMSAGRFWLVWWVSVGVGWGGEVGRLTLADS